MSDRRLDPVVLTAGLAAIAVGVLLALLSLTMQIAVPVVKHVSAVLSSPRFGERRARIVAASLGAVSAAAAALLVLPVL